MAVRSPILNVMGNAALKASRGLIRDFGEVEQLQLLRIPLDGGKPQTLSTAAVSANSDKRPVTGRSGQGIPFVTCACLGSRSKRTWVCPE